MKLFSKKLKIIQNNFLSDLSDLNSLAFFVKYLIHFKCLPRQTKSKTQEETNLKFMSVISRPPIFDTIGSLSAIDRQILEAKVQAQLRRRKLKNVETAYKMPDVADWYEANCWDADKCSINGSKVDYSRSHKVRLTSEQKRIWRKVLTIDPKTGKYPYTTIVISKPKKSGKSAEGGFATSYFAQNVEPPNVIYVVANDREQASGRVFRASMPTLLDLGGRREGKHQIWMPNGTLVQALTADPEKEAGGSYGLVVFDEIWGYKSERARLLFDELRPVETRNISIRIIVSYAGFIDASDLLYSIYKEVFTDYTETATQPQARAVPELSDIVTTNSKGEVIPCCYEVPSKGLFYYNDHERRMDWQSDDDQADALSSDTSTLRHKFNRWQATENRFVEPDALKDSEKENVSQARRMTFALDAGWKRDCSGIVGVYKNVTQRNGENEVRYVTGFARAWYPAKEADPLGLDLDATLGAEVVRLWKAGLIHRRSDSLLMPAEKAIIEKEGLTPIDVWYDPREMHAVAMRLRTQHKLLIAEFSQKTERLLSDSFLQKQYKDRKIDNIQDADLLSHIAAAKAVAQVNKSEEQQIRIQRGAGEHAKPIDLAVCQSMAVWRCSKRPVMFATGLSQATGKGWTAGTKKK